MGTAFDAIMKNLSASYASKAAASGYDFAGSMAKLQAINSSTKHQTAMLQLAALQGLSDPNNQLNNPTWNLAQAVLKVQTTPAQATSGAVKSGGIWDSVWGGTKSVGKFGLDMLTRPMHGVGSALNQLKNDYPNPNSSERGLYSIGGWESLAKGAWKGLSGQEHISPGDVVAEKVDNSALKFATALSADILMDPVTYTGLGPIVKGVKAIKGALVGSKAASVAEVAAKPLEGIIVDSTPKAIGYTPTKAIEAPPRVFTAGPSGIHDPTNPVKDMLALTAPGPRFAAGTEGIADKLNPVQFADALTRQNITKAVQEAPTYKYPGLTVDPLYKGVTTTTKVPKLIDVVESYPIAKGPTPLGSGAREAAIRDAILKTPSYKIAGFPVSSWAAGLADKDLELLLQKHVQRISESRDFTGIKNAKGLQRVLDGAAKTDSPFDMTFLEDLGKSVEPATKTRKVVTMVDANVTTPTRISKAEKLAWTIKHSAKLTPEEVKYIGSANSPALFAKRVAEMQTKTIVGGSVKTLSQFMDMASKGHIPQDYIDTVLKQQGVRSLSELEAKANKVLSKSGNSSARAIPMAETTTSRTARPTLHDKWWSGVETPSVAMGRIAATGGESIVRSAGVPVTAQIASDLRQALPTAIFKNVIDPTDKVKWAWVTDIDKALRTSPKPFEGRARNYYGWHSFAQSDLMRSLIKSATERSSAIGSKLKGAEKTAYWKTTRPRDMYDEVVPALTVAEDALRKTGVKLIAGVDNNGILLSLGDVLTSLPRDVVEKFMFKNPAMYMNVYPTGFLNAAEHMVTAAIHGGNADLAKQAAAFALKDAKTGGNLSKHKAGEAAAASIVESISKAMPSILQKVNENYASHSLQVGTAVQSMTEEVVTKLMQGISDAAISSSDAFSSVVNRSNEIGKVGSAIGAPAEANPIARVLVDSELSSRGIGPGDLAEANTARTVTSGGSTVGKAAEASLKASGTAQQASREAEARTASAAMGENVVDLEEEFAVKLNAGLFRGNVGLLNKLRVAKEVGGKTFVGSYGISGMHDMLWGSTNAAREFNEMHRTLMSATAQVAVKYAGNDASKMLSEAFRHLQFGSNITDPGMLEVMDSMRKSIDIVFSGGKNGSFITRNGFFPQHVNKLMDYYGVPKHIRFDVSNPLTDQAEVWKSWADVGDPLDTLDRIHSAYQFALTDATIGRTISTTSEFASKVPKEGFVKLTDDRGLSNLYQYMDPNMYYSRDIIKQLPYYESIRNLASTGSKNSNLTSVLNVFDRAQNIWKSGVTVLRPGHHVANGMGDVILNWLAGVNNPAQYTKAARVLSGRSKMYADWDGLAALQNDIPLAKSAAKGSKILVAGKFAITDDEVWRSAHAQGLLSDFRTAEELSPAAVARGTANPVRKIGRTILKTAGRTSDLINHHTRMAQFIDVLEKSTAKTLDEAVAEAGAATRKWHPDGTDLTNFERKVMRRAIPFYSWMRKSTPLIIEALATKPGRTLVIPKAQHNFAQVMGMDPDSIADPFPIDAMLPSYLRNNVITGPEFSIGAHNYGASLSGDPVAGTLNSTLKGNPISTLLQAATPFAKVPYELATGTGFGTGIPIGNTTDYLDRQIPIAGPIAAITGHSVTGGLGSTGAVDKGNVPAGINPVALTNWMTGLGITDYSTPSIKKGTLAELRQKYSDMAKERAKNNRG